VARPVSLVAVIKWCQCALLFGVAGSVSLFGWIAPFLRPGLISHRRRAQPRSSMAAGHREAAQRVLDWGEHGANLGQAGALSCHPSQLFLMQGNEAPISMGQRSGQLRPYVRPVTRHSPLAIMGVRVRVRHQSVWRAQGTRLLTVLPDLDYRVFPITLLRLPAGSVGFTPVACHPMERHHAAAYAAAATPPFGR
jgi:hypothetical protein